MNILRATIKLSEPTSRDYYISKMEESFDSARKLVGPCECPANTICHCGRMILQNALAVARFYAQQALREPYGADLHR